MFQHFAVVDLFDRTLSRYCTTKNLRLIVDTGDEFTYVFVHGGRWWSHQLLLCLGCLKIGTYRQTHQHDRLFAAVYMFFVVDELFVECTDDLPLQIAQVFCLFQACRFTEESRQRLVEPVYTHIHFCHSFRRVVRYVIQQLR